MQLKTNPLFENLLAKDALSSILFGGISIILGMVQFHTPGFEGSYSDLREIALLIGLFHLRNPLFVVPLSLLTLIGLPAEVPLFPTFIMHVVPLAIGWFVFKWIERKKMSARVSGVAWFLFSLVYYTVFLYPLLILSYQWVGINASHDFGPSYFSILNTGKFEMIASSLVSSLYLVQSEIRKSLEHTNKNLEGIVHRRTMELTSANSELQSLNEELVSSSEEVRSLNENLERLIKERTQKINIQLSQLMKYAHMNSHEVRAPLARILGLMDLLRKEGNGHDQELLDKLYYSSEELDSVIKNMNQLLEREISSSE